MPIINKARTSHVNPPLKTGEVYRVIDSRAGTLTGRIFTSTGSAHDGAAGRIERRTIVWLCLQGFDKAGVLDDYSAKYEVVKLKVL